MMDMGAAKCYWDCAASVIVVMVLLVNMQVGIDVVHDGQSLFILLITHHLHFHHYIPFNP